MATRGAAISQPDRLIIGGWCEYAPGHRDAILPLLVDAAIASRGDRGCLEFVVGPDPTNENRVVLFEAWASEADQVAHLDTPHLATFIERAAAYPMTVNGIVHYLVPATAE